MAGPRTPTRRIALYSHDTQGLGHIRRNSLIAHAITAADPTTDVLLISGARESTALPLPTRCEVIVLPGVYKDPVNGYRPQHWSGTLDEVVAVRSGTIHGAITAFKPHVFIVDKTPTGVGGELLQTLSALRHTDTSTVLGLRDVLDAPSIAIAEWAQSACTPIIDQYYDDVWIYGDRAVYDPIFEYSIPNSVSNKATFTGYLGHGRELSSGAPSEGEDPYVLCLIGGGQDGLDLAYAFAAATPPPGIRRTVVTGPYLPEHSCAVLRKLASQQPDLTVVGFVPDVLQLIQNARAVVTMGGYNSVCEILASGRPALIAPRTAPRLEQLVRAERLQAMGLVDVLTAISPDGISEWLTSAVTRAPADTSAVDLHGLSRIPRLVNQIVHRAATRPLTFGDHLVPV